MPRRSRQHWRRITTAWCIRYALGLACGISTTGHAQQTAPPTLPQLPRVRPIEDPSNPPRQAPTPEPVDEPNTPPPPPPTLADAPPEPNLVSPTQSPTHLEPAPAERSARPQAVQATTTQTPPSGTAIASDYLYQTSSSSLPERSLDDVLSQARADPPAVLAAHAALQRAEADLGYARGQWFPVVTSQISYGYAYDNRLVLPGVPRIRSESLEARASLNLEWQAYKPDRAALIDSARASTQAATYALHDSQQIAMLAAAELFFQASSAQELVQDAELSLLRRGRQHEATVQLVEAGTRSPVDAQRAGIEVTSARYALSLRQAEALAAMAALAAAVGQPPTTLVRPVPEPALPLAPEITGPDDARRLAREHSPALQQVRAEMRAAQENHSAALQARLPTFGAALTGSSSYLDVRRGAGISGTQYNAVASVFLRFQGLDPALWLRADATAALLVQARRTREELEHRLGSDAVQAHYALLRARIERQRAIAILGQARAAREAQHGRYLAGLASLLELLDAEDLEQEARVRRIEARRDEAIAVARLLAACGVLGRPQPNPIGAEETGR